MLLTQGTPMVRRAVLSLSVVTLLAAGGLQARHSAAASSGMDTLSTKGTNLHPVRLVRPKVEPLSAVALLGRQVFYDVNLSGSGQISCASCHSPSAAYGPPNDQSVQRGGVARNVRGMRAVPSLRYADRAPNFTVGPEQGESESAPALSLAAAAAQASGTPRPTKLAGSQVSSDVMVPQGGLFWDGRVNTLQDQAMGPLLSPAEMANRDVASVAATLEKASYREQIEQLFGARIFQTPGRLVDEVMFAVATYQIEDSSFHPYSSKYDYYLEGKARLSPSEARGLARFEDTSRANCAGCHLDRPSADGEPPMFTDYQYEALGVPRNAERTADRHARDVDLGLCGPIRTDLTRQPQYCGMFRTPSLRNAATRKVFFHNGVYHTLDQVLAFYDYRDIRPEETYGRGAALTGLSGGGLDDLPAAYRANLDVTDPPLNRRLGDQPAMTDDDMRDLIAFLETLTDGYQPGQRQPTPPERRKR